ncbi:hypothetical protein GCM10027598_04140 [Amycolatopsis oliviviridis]|uniref:Secreted protein n=1 Tax=Amycolatopsis oliviviridis TaxID=1471590 RepID=A0ABQ3LVA7_9PSEU|nr:hypothetical protein GCM10017790_37530 [Amycolatopsis oliviviridis]
MIRAARVTLVHKMWATWGQCVDHGVEILWIACECDVDGNPITAGPSSAGVVHKLPTACGFLCTQGKIQKCVYARTASFTTFVVSFRYPAFAALSVLLTSLDGRASRKRA